MKLELGSGETNKDGYLTVDILKGCDFQYDLTKIPWPWEDNSVEHINSTHFFQEVRPRQVLKMWRECHRILKPGGKITFCLADLSKNIQAALLGKRDHFLAGGSNLDAAFINHVQWKGSSISFFNHGYCEEKLEEIGFKKIKFVKPESRPHESLQVEAVK